MGRVYAAVHPGSGSRVAIKLIAERYAKDNGLLERFFAEAKAVNLIRHENIVNIIDLVQTDVRPFIVMELVTGQTLRQLAQTSSPMGGIVHVMIEVLAGLAAAHAIGIVHRDLKPDNILVTTTGHAKLLDFGIAKLTGVNAIARTQTGVVLGTPEYMAPEMVIGDPVDGRADLYAIGLILYELLAGRRPWAFLSGGTDFDIMRAHVEKPVTSPREHRPEIPEALERIVMRALSKRPADRYETATAMQKALRRVAVELLGDGQWKPLLGEWLPPAAMTQSLVSTVTKPAAATVRAKRLSQEPQNVSSKRRPIAIPIAVGVIAIAVIVLMIVRGTDEAPKPPPPVVASTKTVPVARHEPLPAPVVEHDPPAPIAETPRETPKSKPAPAASIPKAPIDPNDLAWRGYLPTALAVASQSLEKARLVEIEFEKVSPDGHVNLSDPGRYVLYSFRGQGYTCGQLVKRTGDDVDAESINTGCALPGIHWPRCTLAQIRARLHVQRPDLASYDLSAVYQDDRWIIGAAVLDDDCKD